MKLKALEISSHLHQDDVARQDICIFINTDNKRIKVFIEQADIRSAIASLIEKLIESETTCYSCRTPIPKNNPEERIESILAKAFRNYKDEKELPFRDGGNDGEWKNGKWADWVYL